MLNFIIIYGPVLIAAFFEVLIASAVISKVTSYFKNANKAVDEIKESAEYKNLKAQMKIVLEENAKLKSTLNKVLLKLSHVRVQDESKQDN